MVKPRQAGRRLVVAAVVVAGVVGGSTLIWRLSRPATPGTSSATEGRVVHTAQSGTLDVVVSSPTGTLRSGRNTFTVEFRSPSGDLVDVGTVRVSANMTMPGMVMSGNAQVQPTGVAGRVTVTAEFGMAGAWPITIEWDGPAGQGTVTIQGSVQ
ncbi:MAG: FixH family protein [Vicinamibacterales bacterium]